MHGRIIKRGNFYHCIFRDKIYPIEVDTDDKLNNGDLVLVNIRINRKTLTFKKSELTVLKRVSPKAKFININDSTPLIKRLENRILDLRMPVNQARFIVRSEINRTLSRLFDDRGYISVNTPLVVRPVVEGRVKTFDIDFFGREASLTMTKLIHLRYLTCSDFEKVYDLSPVFVGGSHHTSSHVAEYYTFDWASSEKSDFLDYLKFVDHILFTAISKLSKFVTSSSLDIELTSESLLEEIKRMKVVTYNELIQQYTTINTNDQEALKQFHIPSRIISFAHNYYGNYLWITEFPEQFKQFYCDTQKRGDKEVVLASELWWNGIKIASVSFSNSDYEKTLSRIRKLGLSPNNFKIYLNAIRLGSFEAYLGSLYIERLMMVVLKIDNMKETILFPRAARGTVLDP